MDDPPYRAANERRPLRYVRNASRTSAAALPAPTATATSRTPTAALPAPTAVATSRSATLPASTAAPAATSARPATGVRVQRRGHSLEADLVFLRVRVVVHSPQRLLRDTVHRRGASGIRTTGAATVAASAATAAAVASVAAAATATAASMSTATGSILCSGLRVAPVFDLRAATSRFRVAAATTATAATSATDPCHHVLWSTAVAAGILRRRRRSER